VSLKRGWTRVHQPKRHPEPHHFLYFYVSEKKKLGRLERGWRLQVFVQGKEAFVGKKRKKMNVDWRELPGFRGGSYGQKNQRKKGKSEPLHARTKTPGKRGKRKRKKKHGCQDFHAQQASGQEPSLVCNFKKAIEKERGEGWDRAKCRAEGN